MLFEVRSIEIKNPAQYFKIIDMKTTLNFFLLFAAFLILSCGPGKSSDRSKEIKDSTLKADSMAKILTEAESWDMLQLAMTNEAGFNNKYGNKKLRIKNLVVDDISKKGTIHCLAYSPVDSMISNTSQKGDAAKKVAEYKDFVNEVPCRINSDFTYHFNITLADASDTIGLKVKKIKEEKLSRKSYFYSIITIEGESIIFKEDVFTLKNCKVLKQE
jgi:hypothetical protein